jgi:hypothetical protein
MEPRTIAIGLIAVIAAFAAAFGISSAGGGEKTATAGPGTKAESIKAPASAAVAGVEVGGTIPALKAEKKKAAKKPKKESTSNSNASAPSTNNTTTQTQTQAPAAQNTAPTTNSNPAPSTPKPSTPKPKPQTPVSGGGEDG